MPTSERTRTQVDLSLQTSRRAFPVAQAAFDGPAQRVAVAAASIGWFGTAEFPEAGAVALAKSDGPLEDLVGRIVRVVRSTPTRDAAVFVYVYSSSPLEDDVDFAVSRRAFFALGLLSLETVSARIEVVA